MTRLIAAFIGFFATFSTAHAQELPTYWQGTASCRGGVSAIWASIHNEPFGDIFVINSVDASGGRGASSWRTQFYTIEMRDDSRIELSYGGTIRPDSGSRSGPDVLNFTVEGSSLTGSASDCRYQLDADPADDFLEIGMDSEWREGLIGPVGRGGFGGSNSSFVKLVADFGRVYLVSYSARDGYCVWSVTDDGSGQNRRVPLSGTDWCSLGQVGFGEANGNKAVQFLYDDGRNPAVVAFTERNSFAFQQLGNLEGLYRQQVALREEELARQAEQLRREEEERARLEAERLAQLEAERLAQERAEAARREAIQGALASAQSAFSGLDWSVGGVSLAESLSGQETEIGGDLLQITTSTGFEGIDGVPQVEITRIIADASSTPWSRLVADAAHWHAAQRPVLIQFVSESGSPEQISGMIDTFGEPISRIATPGAFGLGGEESNAEVLVYPVKDGAVTSISCPSIFAVDLAWSEDMCDGVLTVTIYPESGHSNASQAFTITARDFRLQAVSRENDTELRSVLSE